MDGQTSLTLSMPQSELRLPTWLPIPARSPIPFARSRRQHGPGRQQAKETVPRGRGRSEVTIKGQGPSALTARTCPQTLSSEAVAAAMMERVQPSLNTGSALAKMQLITIVKMQLITKNKNKIHQPFTQPTRPQSVGLRTHTQTPSLALTSNKHTHTLWASGRALGTVRFSSVNKVKWVHEFGKIMYMGPKGSARARSVPKSRTGPGLSQ